MASLFDRLFGSDRNGDATATGLKRPRLAMPTSPAVAYCIGDVHGCLALLQMMEEAIVADGAGFDGEKWIVLLGDVIDRGPRSAQVIDHLLTPPPAGFNRFCLAGNHEQGMLEFLDAPRRITWWLEYGGMETLASYDIDASEVREGRMSATRLRHLLGSYVPEEHRQFLRGLPVAIETPDWILVHAGLEPGRPLARQTDETLLWYRDDFASRYDEWGKLVVHGHTPLDEVFVSPYRIDVDTGAVMSGRLSAVRLTPGASPVVMQVTAGRWSA